MQTGDDPDTRPILINDESGEDWERYDMTGEQFPQPEHEFRTAHEMAD